MPAGVARIVGAGKPDYDVPEIQSPAPRVGIKHLRDGLAEMRRIGCFLQLLAMNKAANNRRPPTPGIGEIDTELLRGEESTTGGKAERTRT